MLHVFLLYSQKNILWERLIKSYWIFLKVCSMCGQEFSNVVVLETHWIRHGIEVSKEKRHQSPDRPSKVSFSNSQMEVREKGSPSRCS